MKHYSRIHVFLACKKQTELAYKIKSWKRKKERKRTIQKKKKWRICLQLRQSANYKDLKRFPECFMYGIIVAEWGRKDMVTVVFFWAIAMCLFNYITCHETRPILLLVLLCGYNFSMNYSSYIIVIYSFYLFLYIFFLKIETLIL